MERSAIRERPIAAPDFAALHPGYKPELILRLARQIASRVDAQPARGGKPLLRQEAALVVHLLGAFDPVAEIDVGQSLPARARDVVEDHEGAERAAFLRRLEERIHHR